MKKFLKEVFKGVEKEEISKLEKIFEEVTFQKDEPIVKEGEYGEEIYILRKGNALVTKKEKVLAELHPGDIIGEMSLIEGSVRSATVLPTEKTTLIKSKSEKFYKLLCEKPRIAVCLLRTLSNRLRRINEKVVEKALQEERLAVLGRLGSTIIHDLKSPLSAIKGYANILEEEENDIKYKKYAKSINNATDFAFEMIEDILEFGRGKSTLETHPVNIPEFLKEVVELSGKESTSKEIEYLIKTPPRLYFEFDPFKIKRVLLNLLKNAREAIEKKGKIEIGAEKTKDGIKLYVRDTGVGMSGEVISRIFEPFFTYGKKGTGLGMTVVKKIIDEHDAEIEIDTAKGKGTTFNIFFKKKTGEAKDD
jgi:signal transduction histidine kinase